MATRRRTPPALAPGDTVSATRKPHVAVPLAALECPYADEEGAEDRAPRIGAAAFDGMIRDGSAWCATIQQRRRTSGDVDGEALYYFTIRDEGRIRVVVRIA